MNHVYRIVWNCALGAWTAVAEIATGRGRGQSARTRTRRAARTALLALPAAGIGLAALAQTVTVAPGQQVRAYVSPNGTTVVDIAGANAAGVSHNRFTTYNVGAKGVVLNNTTAKGALFTSSELAGAVMANRNAVNAAKVIVNEVVSANRSVLAGFTEVAGQRADVVVANPYGITCTGCGFINTDRVTLATGLPRLATGGGLAGFDVTQGDIFVNGTGLNATAQQILDLVTRQVKLDAPVHARDLGVFAGTGQWDYAGRSLTAGAALPGAPTYAIDSSALGGMYANSIRLVGTEAGVGVRMLGDAAASSGDFTVTAAGRVELRGRVSAQRDVLLASSSADAAAIAFAGNSVTGARSLLVQSAGGIALSGSTLAAGGGGIALSASQLAASGRSHVDSEGALRVEVAGAVSLADTSAAAKGDITLTAGAGLSIGAGAGQGIQSTEGAVALQAGGTIVNAGVVSADAGSLSLRAGTQVENSGMLNAGGSIAVEGLGGTLAMFGNDGTLLAGGALSVRAAAISNAGTLQGASLAAHAQTLDNSGLLLAAGGAAALDVVTAFINTGTVQATTDLVLRGGTGVAAGSAANSGRMLAGGVLDLWAATLGNETGGLLQGGVSGRLRAMDFTNAGTVLLNQDGAGTASIAATGTLLNSGLVQAEGALQLSAEQLVNQGEVLAEADASVTAGSFVNDAGAALVSQGVLSLSADSLENRAGAVIQSRLGASLAAGGVDNRGTLLLSQSAAGTGVMAVSGTLSNRGAIESTGGLDLSAGTLENHGGIAAQGFTQLAVTGSLANEASGIIRGATGLSAEFGTELVNAGLLQAGTGAAGATTFLGLYSEAGHLGNTGSIEGGMLDANIGSLENNGAITGAGGGSWLVVDGELANRAGATLTLGDASATSLVEAGRIANAGTLQTQGGVSLALGDDGLLNTGSLLVGGALGISARGGNAYAAEMSGQVRAGESLTVQGDAGSSLVLSGTANVQAGTVDIRTGVLTIGARSALVAQKSVGVEVGTLELAEATEIAGGVETVVTGRLLGAMAREAGTQVNVAATGDLAIAGLIYSGTSLNVTAPNIHVKENAALSALDNLTVTANAGEFDLLAAGADPAAGRLFNEGLLFAGKTLSAHAHGELRNRGFIAAGTQGVDDGTILLTANTLVNNRDIVSEGDVRVVATRLRNEVEGGDRRVFREVWGGWSVWDEWDDNGDGGNLDFGRTYGRSGQQFLEWLPGEMPTVWPRLTATKRVELYFNSGSNLGGLIQGVGSVLLQGFVAGTEGTDLVPGVTDGAGRRVIAPVSANMASFENNSLATVVTDRIRRHTHTRKEAGPAGGDEIYDWTPCAPGMDPICVDSDNGVQRGFVVETDTITHVQTTQIPGYAGARIYTASLSGGGFVLYNEGSSTPATFTAPALQTTTTLLTTGRPAPQPGAPAPSALPGTGTQTGWIPVETAIQPVTVVGADGQPLQTGITFGGISVKLPNGPNSLFVLAKDPSAGYLIEGNPLYGVGSASAGSDYLRDRLGFSTDEALLRLGDGAYESWLVQQQLIAQTGSMLLKGYGSQDAQMRGLMDNAAKQASVLGLVWGRPLTAQQQAALRSDIVWMVSTVVNGQTVLVPVVYLSQATKDGIRTGAIIAADESTLKVGGVANSGTIDANVELATQAGRGGLGIGPTGSLGLPLSYRDQSFEIVKAYLLSESPDKTVRFGDVNVWLEKNKSNPAAIGEVLPFAFQRFMSLAQGGGIMSESDKSFVTFVGEFAKAQRLAAIDDALAAYDAWKKGPKLGQQGKHTLLTSLFDLGESPPDTIMALAKSGITWQSEDEAKRIGTMLGVSVGAGAAGGAAGGASAALMNQIFPYLGRALASAAGSTITAAGTATGPLAIVTAAAAIAGQAVAKVVKDANFEKDLLKLRSEYEGVAGSNVQYWLQKEGGAEQIMLSMAKMMAQ